MTYPQRSRPGPSWAAFTVLLVLTLLSLVVNGVMLYAGWRIYSQATPVVEAAAGLGSSLRQASEEPLTLNVTIRQDWPLRVDFPLRRTVEVSVDEVVPVDTAFRINIDVPAIGLISQTFPIHLDIPVRTIVPVQVSTTVPISMNLPISVSVPLTVDLNELPIGQDLGELGRVLEELGPQEP